MYRTARLAHDYKISNHFGTQKEREHHFSYHPKTQESNSDYAKNMEEMEAVFHTNSPKAYV